MGVKEIGGFSVAGCADCEGIFIPPETFEMMQDSSKRVIESVSRQGKRQYELDYDVVYLPCPVCGKFMTRRNFATTSGVIIDVCSDHGIWFDRGEMEKIMDFVARGGIQKARQAQLERLKDEAKMEKLKRERIASMGQRPSGLEVNLNYALAADSILEMLHGVVSSFMKR
jgi:Zn-finger nucleic acid-binding protein